MMYSFSGNMEGQRRKYTVYDCIGCNLNVKSVQVWFGESKTCLV